MQIQSYTKDDIPKWAGERVLGGVFRALHYYHDPVTGLRDAEPYAVYEARNSIVNVGGVALLNLLIGAGGTAFNNANSWIGVGDSSAATTAGMTDLQATLAATIAIVSSTNASPIVLTTGTHGLTAGQTITVSGHTVNTAANGTWVITVPSSTTLGLTGSTGNGVGGATGTAAQGNRFRRPMDATFPSLTAQTMTWQMTLAPGQAEWGTGILEGGLFNGSLTSATMLARAAQSLGVKAASTTLVIQYTVHSP